MYKINIPEVSNGFLQHTAMVGLASTEAIHVMWDILGDRGWAAVDHAMYLGADASPRISIASTVR